MTNRLTKQLTGLVCAAVLCVGTSQLIANDSSDVAKVLGTVPAPELPAQAAKLIKGAKARDRETVTISVVTSAVKANPAATPLVIGAIAKSTPEMASVAASTAAALQPEQAAAITKAAVSAAPSRAGKVVAAVCAAVPKQYRAVAVAAAEAAPTSGKDILKSVASTMPELKVHIEKELAGYGVEVPPVAMTLDQALVSAGPSVAGSPVYRGSDTGAPGAGGGGSPSGPPPGTIGAGPPAGRNYSRP